MLRRRRKSSEASLAAAMLADNYLVELTLALVESGALSERAASDALTRAALSAHYHPPHRDVATPEYIAALERAVQQTHDHIRQAAFRRRNQIITPSPDS